MKFYDCSTAPSPRRVRIFLAEKELNVPVVQVDLRNGEQLTETFRRINPQCEVPVLELDDGTIITETIAICRYLEDIHPLPPLLGVTAREKALIAMWDHKIEVEGFLAIAEAFRNRTAGFQERALAGPENYDQIPELVERGQRRAQRFFRTLDDQLAKNLYVAGDNFSMADISAFIAVDFSAWIKASPLIDHLHIKRWYETVAARPSLKA